MAGVGQGGRRGRRPCLASRWGEEKQGERDKMVADGWDPHGSERKRKVGNSWAGCFGGLKCTGGLRRRRTRGNARGGPEDLAN
jgi:hypothetical protein